MNEQRRQAVLEIIEKINRLYADVNDIKSLIANIESEQDKAVSNAPNNLQNTELFKAMQKALGYIEEAKNEIDNAMIKNIVFIEGRRDGYSVDQIYKNTMTVGELVNYLTLNFDTDALIMLCNDNGYTYGTITEDSISDKNIRIIE